jgi:hypothetical protein
MGSGGWHAPPRSHRPNSRSGSLLFPRLRICLPRLEFHVHGLLCRTFPSSPLTSPFFCHHLPTSTCTNPSKVSIQSTCHISSLSTQRLRREERPAHHGASRTTSSRNFVSAPVGCSSPHLQTNSPALPPADSSPSLLASEPKPNQSLPSSAISPPPTQQPRIQHPTPSRGASIDVPSHPGVAASRPVGSVSTSKMSRRISGNRKAGQKERHVPDIARFLGAALASPAL